MSDQSANPVAPNPAANNAPIIVFDDVSISFGDHAVLQHVSFSIQKGQTLCILGRSGVGKSVALRVLMGFLKPDSGSVRVEGQEVTDARRGRHAGDSQARHHGVSEWGSLRFAERA